VSAYGIGTELPATRAAVALWVYDAWSPVKEHRQAPNTTLFVPHVPFLPTDVSDKSSYGCEFVEEIRGFGTVELNKQKWPVVRNIFQGGCRSKPPLLSVPLLVSPAAGASHCVILSGNWVLCAVIFPRSSAVALPSPCVVWNAFTPVRHDRIQTPWNHNSHHQQPLQVPYKVAVRNLSSKGNFAVLLIDGQKVLLVREFSSPPCSVSAGRCDNAVSLGPLRAGASSPTMRHPMLSLRGSPPIFRWVVISPHHCRYFSRSLAQNESISFSPAPTSLLHKRIRYPEKERRRRRN